MSMHLITGYAGSEHITSADQGAYNIATYGGGEFVLNRGNKFVTTIVSNNSITVADGEAMMQGRYIKMIPGTSETVTIDNGTSGMKRNDLICLRYEKDSDTGIESVSMVVVKGTESSSTPEDPEYTQGTITDGTDLVNEMPLYRVYINGLNIDSVTQLFSVKVSMVDYMDEYQLPSAMNFDGTLGGVKLTQNSLTRGLDKATTGELILANASRTRLGGIKIGNGLFINGNILSAHLKLGTIDLHPTRDISITAHNKEIYVFEVNSSAVRSMRTRGILEFIGVFASTYSVIPIYNGVHSWSGDNYLALSAYLCNYDDTTFSRTASNFEVRFMYIYLYDGQ